MKNVILSTEQSKDVIPQTKLTEISDHRDHTSFARDRRRSHSRDRLDNVTYDKNALHGDEVSIGLQWTADGVSISMCILSTQLSLSFYSL